MNDYHLIWLKDDWKFWWNKVVWWAKPITLISNIFWTIVHLVCFAVEFVIDKSIKK
jgi:hypothetical protein